MGEYRSPGPSAGCLNGRTDRKYVTTTDAKTSKCPTLSVLGHGWAVCAEGC